MSSDFLTHIITHELAEKTQDLRIAKTFKIKKKFWIWEKRESIKRYSLLFEYIQPTQQKNTGSFTTAFNVFIVHNALKNSKKTSFEKH